MRQKLPSVLVDNKKVVPGPGNYESSLKNKKDAPKYGFGSSKREESPGKKNVVPGPGQYKINTSIGDVPAYSMPNRTDD
eukprot:CAMPEP_0168621178 /NCGR_PEP_ID=MMETSP0449_2-20121227/7548_1 /TAXON_ID=1082188 /ORGANISM="Strombidium rassoulzadegani, Strain ras09" /LENGTH=78 /DNA_ID=CAMNT_0008662265 /DNA_START=516 /DNA_END=752 /DNA_ORIENTATION=+